MFRKIMMAGSFAQPAFARIAAMATLFLVLAVSSVGFAVCHNWNHYTDTKVTKISSNQYRCKYWDQELMCMKHWTPASQEDPLLVEYSDYQIDYVFIDGTYAMNSCNIANMPQDAAYVDPYAPVLSSGTNSYVYCAPDQS